MGGGQSIVEVTTDTDSRGFPGKKCVQTAPLDEHAEYGNFWMQLINTLKNDYAEQPNYKTGAVIPISSTVFEVHVVLDGQAMGKPSDIVNRIIYTVDNEKCEITEEARDLGIDVLHYLGVMKVLRAPLQVEYWRQFAMPTLRKSGPMIATLAQRVLSHSVGRELTIEENQPSPSVPGALSAISESLENDTDMASLFASLIKTVKTQGHNQYLVGEPKVDVVIETEDFQIFNVHNTLDGQKMLDAGLVSELPPGGQFKLRFHVRVANKGNGLTIQSQKEDLTLLDITHFMIHPNPLRVEVFAIGVGPPMADEAAKDMLSKYVDSAVKRAQA